MGGLDEACKAVVAQVSGAVACAVIDLDSGFVLGAHSASALSLELTELMARATLNLLRGPDVTAIEREIRKARGVAETGEHYFQELQLSSEHSLHFGVVLKGGRAVLVLVTRRSTGVGMGWAQLRAPRFRSSFLLQRADALVFILDGTPDGVDEALPMFERARSFVDEHRLPLIVQANKQDLSGAIAPEEIARRLGMEPALVVPARSDSGQGVRETALLIIRPVADQLKQRILADGLESLSTDAPTGEALVRAMQAQERSCLLTAKPFARQGCARWIAPRATWRSRARS
jgi:hypothetical protein